VALIRLLFACVVIGAVAFATFQWRSPGSVATAAPIHYAAEPATGGFPASALDLREHGRGPVVPPAALSGFAVPVGFDLPDDPDLLPGSAREYRAGFHEGIDFPLAFGMPVAAAKGGRIIRIDRDYVEWSVDEQLKAEDDAYHLGYTPAATLDKERGRQVWIDHGNGIVTRYAHLLSVELFSVGSIVEQGTIIGHAGNSGTKAGPHLHIEIRIGDDYLGDGLAGDDLLRVLRRAFDVTPGM